MKTNWKHIAITWILLFCFTAGQWVVWSHQHNFPRNLPHRYSQHIPHRSVFSENCHLCDAMHYNAMAVFSPVYIAPVTVSNYYYKDAKYEFTSVTLILSEGRSPPVA